MIINLCHHVTIRNIPEMMSIIINLESYYLEKPDNGFPISIQQDLHTFHLTKSF